MSRSWLSRYWKELNRCRVAPRKQLPLWRRFVPRIEPLEGRYTPTTLTVTSALDTPVGGSMNLRQALQQAGLDFNAGNGADQIVFDPGLNGSTIHLSAGPLLVSFNVTITGPGTGQLTIDGGSASRLFTITSGNVVISGLKLADGLAAQGGAIYNDGTLELDSIVLSSNVAQGADGVPANNIFANNQGGSPGEGGAIYNAGALVIRGSTLAGNQAVGGTGGVNLTGIQLPTYATGGGGAGLGGAIYAAPGTLTEIEDSTFNANTAQGGDGGGFPASYTTPASNETGGGGAGLGGAFFVNGSTLTATDTTFYANQTVGGDGGNSHSRANGGNGNPATTGTFGQGGGGGQIGGSAGFGGGAGGGLFNAGQAGFFGGAGAGGGGSGSGPLGGGGSGNGGAVFTVSSANVYLTNDTLAANQAAGGAGGTGLAGQTGSNGTGQGGGIYVDPNDVNGNAATPNVVPLNVLAANNSAAAGSDIEGTVNSQGNNLIGNSSGAGGLQGSDQKGINPRLDPAGLQNNGGTTQTVALLYNSPAIDAGNPTGAPGADQRGQTYVGAPDIGAYEFPGVNAVPNSFVVTQGGALTVSTAQGLLANDHGPSGDPLSVSGYTTPASAATFQVNADGSFTYTPAAGFSGTDSFQYTISDYNHHSSTATVLLDVLPATLSYAAVSNVTLSNPAASGVLAGELAADATLGISPNFAAGLITGPAHTASFTFNPDGSFTYRPTPGYRGVDGFTYRVTDANGDTAQASVSFNISPSPSVFLVTSTGDHAVDTPGELRWAIDEANANPGSAIAFAVGAAGSSQTIFVTGSALPAVTAGVLIDGWSQGGPAYTGAPLITVDGSNVAGANGLIVASTDVQVRGLQIQNFAGYGLGLIGATSESDDWVYGNYLVDNGGAGLSVAATANGNRIGTNADGIADAAERNVISGNGNDGIDLRSANNVVAGNYIGLAANGLTAMPNGATGINVTGNGNLIGGLTVAAGNVVSGNKGVGIAITSSGNTVQGNFVGTDGTGKAPLGNGQQGIFVSSRLVANPAANNLIGGTAAGAGNVIAASGSNGLQFNGSAVYGNLAQGNFIGTDPAGDLGLGNTDNGVTFSQGAHDNTLGGTAPGAGNLIAYNTPAGVPANQSGVALFNAGTIDDRITGNSIRGNNGLGIDIFDNGVSLNDADPHTTASPNLAQNFPILTGASATNGVIAILGTLKSAANTTYTVEFFANPAADSSGYGEGQFYLGSASVTTDATGNASFSVPLSGTLSTHEWVSATATDPAGNTSEFSNDVESDTPPKAVNAYYQMNQGSVLSVPAAVGVLADDSDPDGDSLTVNAAGVTPQHGTLTLNSDGSFTYTPAAGFSGTDSFGYIDSDGFGGTATGTVVIQVNPVNSPPIAVSDSYTTSENKPLTVAAPGVLGNDTDANGDTLTASLLNGPAHGTVSLASNGSFTYTPAANYFGNDGFSYQVSDGHGGYAVAGVSLTLSFVNQQPSFTASNPPASSANGGPQTVNNWALFNPGAPGEAGQTATYTVQSVSNSALFLAEPSVDANGTLTYTAGPNASGSSTFTVFVKDSGGTANGGNNTSASQTFTITVSPVNRPPVANSDSYSVNENQVLTVAAPGVLANDSDPDGNSLTASLLNGPAHGTLSLASAGSFIYTPTANFYGSDGFSYQVSDGHGGYASASVSLTVTFVNQTPSFTASSPPVSNENAGPQTVNNWALFNPGAPGEAGQSATYTVKSVSNPSLFAVLPSVDGNGTLTYTATANASGTSTFTVFVKDNGGTANGGTDTSVSQNFAITVNAVNQPPVASPLTITIDENTGLFVSAPYGLVLDVSDPDGDPLTFSLLNGPANGQLNFRSDGSFGYQPNEDFNGTDGFSYKVSDGHGHFDVGSVTLIVNFVNQQPDFAASDPPATNENAGPQTVNNWAVFNPGAPNELDQSATYSVLNVSNSALFVVLPSVDANGTLTYTGAANATGTSTFTIEVQDDGGTDDGGTDTSYPQTFTITVNPVNRPPVAKSDSYSVNENQVLSVAASGVLANDSDPDGNPLTATLLNGPAHGTLTFPGDGSFVYQPAAGYAGTDSFSYQVSDGRGGLAVAGVTLTVNFVPPPVPANENRFGGDAQSGIVGTPLGAPLVVQVTDSNGNSVAGVSVTWAVSSGGGSVGTITSTTDANGLASTSATLGTSAGTDTFTATVAGLNGSITFTATATAGAARYLVFIGGSNQSGVVGTNLSDPLAVEANDLYGNPVSGVAVSWASTLGGVGSASSMTGADGQTSTTASFGTVAGTQVFTASCPGLVGSPILFVETATPDAGHETLSLVSGNRQSGAAGTALADPLVVQVTDPFGNAVPDVSVRWTATGNAGVTASTTTGPNGQVAVEATLGTLTGAYTFTATVGTQSVLFSETATPGPAESLTYVGGDRQTGTVGTALASSLVVQVTDQFGNPVPGSAISWAAVNSGAVSSRTSTTDVGGLAQIAATLGTRAGVDSFEAAILGLNGSPVSFTETADAGAPAGITIENGDTQSTPAAAAFLTNLAVTVEDVYGNPVPGVSIQFTGPASGPGGSFARGGFSFSTVSDSSGVATAPTFTANLFAGTYFVTASASGVSSPVRFHLTNQSSLGSDTSAIYVHNLYALLLHRLPDPGAQGWVAALNSGVAPASVIAAFEGSTEYRQDLVEGFYLHYLDRPADPSGLKSWTDFLTSGGTTEQVIQAFVSSPEYFALHGFDNNDFVTALYRDVLGRGASAGEIQGWVNAISLGATRAQVAKDFLTSTEYRLDLVDSYYAEFLGRPSDLTGRSYWLRQLASGVSDQTVLAAILGSAEGCAKWS